MFLGWALRGLMTWRHPWWTRDGWRRWTILDGDPLVLYVDPAELDFPAERGRAVAEVQEDIARRAGT
jgi:hypothetical protein